ncbi:unnamed protein product [Boreogadus saida]
MVNSSQFPYFILTEYLDMGYMNLLVNQLYGSAGLFPFLLLQITSDTHTISRSMCFLQIYCLYTYASVELCNLAVMSYDSKPGFFTALCGNVIDRLFCFNYDVVLLACSDTTLNNIYGLYGIFLSVLVPLIPILFSYTKILRDTSGFHR